MNMNKCGNSVKVKLKESSTGSRPTKNAPKLPKAALPKEHILIDEYVRNQTWTDSLYSFGYGFASGITQLAMAIPSLLSTKAKDYADTKAQEYVEKQKMCQAQVLPVVLVRSPVKGVSVEVTHPCILSKDYHGRARYTPISEGHVNVDSHLHKWLDTIMAYDYDAANQMRIPKMTVQSPNHEVFLQRLNQVATAVDLSERVLQEHSSVMDHVGVAPLDDTRIITGLQIKAAQKKRKPLQDFLSAH